MSEPLSPDDLLGVLAVLERRVPDRQVTVDKAMAVAWHPTLHRFSKDAAMRAALRYPGSKFPSADEFYRECQRAQYLLSVEGRAVQEQLAVGARDPELQKEINKVGMLVMREIQRRAKAGDSMSDGEIEAFRDSFGWQHLATLETNPCRLGCDRGWFEPDNYGRGTLRPCEECQIVEFAVWEHRTRPGHVDESCPDCVAMRDRRQPDPEWLVDARGRELLKPRREAAPL